MDIPRSIIVPTKYDLARQDDMDDYQDLQVKNYDLSSVDKGQDQDDVSEYDIILENLSLPSNGPVDNGVVGDISKNLYYKEDEGAVDSKGLYYKQDVDEFNIENFGPVDSTFSVTDDLNSSNATDDSLFSYVEKGEGNGNGGGANGNSNQQPYVLGNELIGDYGLLDSSLLGINMNGGDVGGGGGGVAGDDINYVKELESENRSSGNLNPFCVNTNNGIESSGLWEEDFTNNSLAELLFSDTGDATGVHGVNGGNVANTGISGLDTSRLNHKHSVSLPELFTTSTSSSLFGNNDMNETFSRSNNKRMLPMEEDPCRAKRRMSESTPRAKSMIKKKQKRHLKKMHYGNGYTSSSTSSSRDSRSTSNSPSDVRGSTSSTSSGGGGNMNGNTHSTHTNTTNIYSNQPDVPTIPSTTQKGDTITLRQPSFAEGREDVGSFGFINFRKPGAWTREKPQKTGQIEEESSPKSNEKYKRMNMSRIYG